MKRFLVLLMLVVLGFSACNSDDGLTSQIPDTQTGTTPNDDDPTPNPKPDPNPDPDPGPNPDPDPIPGPTPDAKQICHANNFKGQPFLVIEASGNTITASEMIVNCPSLKGEIRRDARKLREFVGDVATINGNKITVNPHDLPASSKAQAGESLKVIWKPRRHKKN